MELSNRIQIEATPTLMAPGPTIAEVLDIARELIEVRREPEGSISIPTASSRPGYTIVDAA